MSTIQAAAPWSAGDRVRLDRPENPNHPRKGRIGTVVRTRWFDERIGRRGVIDNAVWMAVVRFEPAEQVDGFDKLGVGSDWTVFEGELALVERKGERT